ncbi:MAG: hypothetical protein SPF51_06345 [Candidatus Fimivicinus sp.]|nr:hypothetical protein [Candidatus Fimivicinus sp.]
MEHTGACCVGMICTGSGGASPELVPSGTTLCLRTQDREEMLR